MRLHGTRVRRTFPGGIQFVAPTGRVEIQEDLRAFHIQDRQRGARCRALALTACGGTKSNGERSAGSKACDLKIGFFGALTGDAANLGQNIQNGVKLAVSQYNSKHSDCKVNVASFDSQGDAAQAPPLAKKAIDDKTVVGVVGPAFSGESKAADPAFNDAGLTAITPSATATALSTNGWKTFFRVLGNDNSQGPAAAKYMSDVAKVQKPFVMDDASEYGKGLADDREDHARQQGRRHRRRSSRSRPTSRPR